MTSSSDNSSKAASAGEVETWQLMEYCDRGSLQVSSLSFLLFSCYELQTVGAGLPLLCIAALCLYLVWSESLPYMCSMLCGDATLRMCTQ